MFEIGGRPILGERTVLRGEDFLRLGEAAHRLEAEREE